MKRSFLLGGVALLVVAGVLAQSNDVSDHLNNGRRAFSLVVQDDGVATVTLKANSRIDLIATLREITAFETNQVTRTVMQNVLVLGSYSFKNGSLLQLEVTPQEAQLLAALKTDVTFSLALRPKADFSYTKDLNPLRSADLMREMKQPLPRANATNSTTDRQPTAGASGVPAAQP